MTEITYINNMLKNRIIQYYRLNWSAKQTAQRLGCSVVTVEFYYKIIQEEYENG